MFEEELAGVSWPQGCQKNCPCTGFVRLLFTDSLITARERRARTSKLAAGAAPSKVFQQVNRIGQLQLAIGTRPYAAQQPLHQGQQCFCCRADLVDKKYVQSSRLQPSNTNSSTTTLPRTGEPTLHSRAKQTV